MVEFKDFQIGCPGRFQPEGETRYFCRREHLFDPDTKEWRGRQLCQEDVCTTYYAYMMAHGVKG